MSDVSVKGRTSVRGPSLSLASGSSTSILNTRLWRFNGEGFEGHGSKLKRVQVVNAVNELIAKAEEQEGVR